MARANRKKWEIVDDISICLGLKSQRPHHETQRPHSSLMLFALFEQFDIIESPDVPDN